jgi:hypothetical protein
MRNDLSVEYAHIYTNNRIGEEQKLSLDILDSVRSENAKKRISLVVMVDDYSFPDPSFDYKNFVGWLRDQGFQPDMVLRESQLIPACDIVLELIHDQNLKDQICDYVRAKKYPCSLFIATWYLLRLGCITHSAIDNAVIARRLINILPISLKPFEDKALEIISVTQYSEVIERIENRYFSGRLVA